MTLDLLLKLVPDKIKYFCVVRRGSGLRRGGSAAERERGGSEGTSGSGGGSGAGGGSSERNTDRDRDRRGADTGERDSFSRWRDRQYFGPRRWLETALRDTSWDKDGGNA